MRKWTADGLVDEDDGITDLDYSAAAPTSGSSDEERSGVNGGAKFEYVKQEEWGKTTSRGEFVLKDLDEEVNAILAEADDDDKSKSAVGGIGAGAFAYFRNFVGGKVLVKADLEKPMAAMLDHLLRKNVAREAALMVCETVEKSLIGQKTGNFQSEHPKKPLPSPHC